jgi:AcrR family transcriptional regulator
MAMIDAAERIVAERGLPAMSLRKVQEAAGQANRTAAQYHFGSRDGLIDAILSERMGPVDAERRRMLDVLDTAGATAGVRELVEVLVLPVAKLSIARPGSRYARFLAQAMIDPTLAQIVRRHVNTGSFREVIKRLEGAAGGDDLAGRRVEHVIVLASFALARFEGSGRKADEVVGDLVDSCVAVLVGASQ